MALVALASATSKSAFLDFPSTGTSSLTCIFSTGKRFQKFSIVLSLIPLIPLSKAICPLYNMLSLVLKACEFLAKKVSFLVEQAIKKNTNNVAKMYFDEIFFKRKCLKH